MWGNSENSKKTKCLNKGEIKKILIEPITINNAKIEKLNELAEKVQKPEEAADIIKQYKEILRIGSILPRQTFQALQGEVKLCVGGKQLRFTKAC